MPMWRCPHCRTPQHEAARCWVCHRSSTTCSTCRHFRRSLAASVGYCGLDRRRQPLTGSELRGCWTPTPAKPLEAAVADDPPGAVPEAVRRLRPERRPGILEGFVPIELVDRDVAAAPPAAPEERLSHSSPPPPAIIEALDRWADRDSLFGDADR